MNASVTEFEDSIKSRLREHIGTLMPDAMLAELVKKAIQEMFFTRTTTKSGYSSRETEVPSWFEKTVEDLLKDRIRTAMAEYFTTNGAELIKACASEITKRGPELIAETVVGLFQGAVASREFNFSMALAQKLQSSGLKF